MNQEQVWNKIAEPWSKYRKKAPEEVSEFLKNKKGRVLDLGCGSGRNIIPNKDIEYYGVDFSEEMLKFAEKGSKNKRVNAIFFKSTLEKLPFESNFFDSAIFISTLHCILCENNRKKALEELYRVMKKGSIAMVTVWDKESNKLFMEKNLKEGFVNWEKEGVNYQRYYYFYDKKELEALLKKVGFKILKTESRNEKASKHSNKNIIVYVKK